MRAWIDIIHVQEENNYKWGVQRMGRCKVMILFSRKPSPHSYNGTIILLSVLITSHCIWRRGLGREAMCHGLKSWNSGKIRATVREIIIRETFGQIFSLPLKYTITLNYFEFHMLDAFCQVSGKSSQWHIYTSIWVTAHTHNAWSAYLHEEVRVVVTSAAKRLFTLHCRHRILSLVSPRYS